MGRRKNKNKEVEFFDFEIETQNGKDNMVESHIKSSESKIEKKTPSNNINLQVKTHHPSTILKSGLTYNNNTSSIINKQDSVFLFVHKYFSKINSYSDIDDLEIILDKEII